MALSLLAANNAQSVLSAGISSSATTLTVNTGTGALFPSPVSGTSYFKLTLVDAPTGTITEIVHVTARSGDSMTIARAQEGTTARTWSANDIVANMMTAGTLALLAQTNQSLQIANNLSEIAAAGSAAVAAALANLGFSSTGQDVCSAWCIFNGISGVITSSYNISSITKNGAGDYVASFTSPRKNASFTIVGSAYNEGGTSVTLARIFGAGIRTTTAFNCYVFDNNTDAQADSARIEFAVFGGKP